MKIYDASLAGTVTTVSGSTSNLTGSFSGSFSGSYVGNGSGLFNIPASGVTGLELNKIVDGETNATISATQGLRVNTDTIITGSLTVTGNLTAQQFIISSSVTHLTESFASGSHKFGDSSDDNHNFTGSVIITGSLRTIDGITVNNNITIGRGGGNIASNVTIGSQSLQSNTTGILNSAVGTNVLSSNTTGGYNTSVGANSLSSNTTGYLNAALGHGSLYFNTTGNNNSAVGQNALYINSTGFQNSALGSNALLRNTSGHYNSAVGVSALESNTTGYYNSVVGVSALQNNTTGDGNTSLGYNSGRYIANKSTSATIVNNSIMLGYRTSPLGDNQTNQIVIGYDATGLGSNTTVLGNPFTTTTAIKGNLLLGTETEGGYSLFISGSGVSGSLNVNNSLYVIPNKNVGIGTANPSGSLQVSTTTIGTPSIPSLGTTNGYVSTYFTNTNTLYGLLGGSLNDGNSWLQVQRTDNTATAYNLIIQPNGGNVGIGTTSPNNRFEVRNDTNGDLAFWLNNRAVTASGTSNSIIFGGYRDAESSYAVGKISVIHVGGSSGDLNHAGDMVFYTQRANPSTLSERIRITSTGVVQPGANGTQDLGTTSLRWATIYTSDLSLSNGIGDYTIVEGEEKLYLYNNKNNKVYSFVLQEEDPLTATPKKS